MGTGSSSTLESWAHLVLNFEILKPISALTHGWSLPPHSWLTWGSQRCLDSGHERNCGSVAVATRHSPSLSTYASSLFPPKGPSLSFDILCSLPSPVSFSYLLHCQHYAVPLPRVSGMSFSSQQMSEPSSRIFLLFCSISHFQPCSLPGSAPAPAYKY